MKIKVRINIYNLYFIESKKRVNFELSLISVYTKFLDVSNSKYESFVEISSNEFSKICRELYTIDETVKIIIFKKCVKFLVGSHAIGGGLTFETNDTSDYHCKVESENSLELSFSLKYLNKFIKGASICKIVKLQFSKKLPMLIKYDFGQLGTLKFYLAPRYSDDGAKK